MFYYYCKSKLPSGNLEQYYEKVFARIPATKTEYDVAIAFTSIINYLTWYVVYKVKADKKLGWIHFDVKKLSMDKHLLLHLHQQLDHIFIVSKQAENNFIELFPQLAPKCELMYNIVSDKMITEMAKEPVEELKYNDNEFVILTLGRLSHEKGQDLIPEIANKLRNDEVPFCWYLIGDGNLSTFVRNKIQELGLEGNVKLLGTKTNPYPYLKQADIFVQTSRHEGYCISLAEARALNLPIVTTDFSGAFDQIENEKNGLIVPFSVDELYGGVKRLLDNSELRDKFTKNLQSEKCDISEEMQKLYSFIEE